MKKIYQKYNLNYSIMVNINSLSRKFIEGIPFSAFKKKVYTKKTKNKSRSSNRKRRRNRRI